ncbi:uncharacterized protein LOC126739056 isoform X2 [Anthonomus grandis grandis]|uniref:uncharacterized protein LOC126739056 isoform X2 n=1 Tax=Anthonomus grandis grandis TaxID=2921223 RepID=UPI0021654FE0|nr:uncharacterized protein LOC126739056 isoform X2 [Anthonomus grandis grandis]
MNMQKQRRELGIKRFWSAVKNSNSSSSQGDHDSPPEDSKSALNCSLPLLQVWPSSDSPRGEADGQSFVFPECSDGDNISQHSTCLDTIHHTDSGIESSQVIADNEVVAEEVYNENSKPIGEGTEPELYPKRALEQEPLPSISATSTNELPNSQLQKTKRAKRNKENSNVPNEDPRISAVVDIMRSAQDRDSCDIYGEHIASKLRTYSQRTQAMVQHMFSNILFNADMGRYEDVVPKNTSVHLSSSEGVTSASTCTTPASSPAGSSSQYSDHASQFRTHENTSAGAFFVGSQQPSQ